MLILKTNKKFEKDLSRAIKRGKNQDKLWEVVEKLLELKPLPLKNKPHKLSGDWGLFWECHIEPDWLLIYNNTGTHLELIRTGTHSDLF